MAILFFLGMWAIYFWLARICIRKSVAVKATGRRTTEAPARSPGMDVPDTVPAEWVEAYRAENGA